MLVDLANGLLLGRPGKTGARLFIEKFALLIVCRTAAAALVQHRRRVAQSQLHGVAVRSLRHSRGEGGMRTGIPANRGRRDTAEGQYIND